MNRRVLRSAAAALLALALLGCGKAPLYTQLTERQANEIVALLLNARIDADKLFGDDKSWRVAVAKSDLPRAVEVLHNVGYPREVFQSLGDVFKKEGFVSSPIEERARWIHGRQQELEQTLYSIDGVVKARVHLAIPERDPLSDKVRPSSASVFIKHQADVNLSNYMSSIRTLLVKSVEGLAYDDVTVVFFPARSWPVMLETPPPPTYWETLDIPRTVALVAAIAAVLTGLGWALRRYVPDWWQKLGRAGAAVASRAAPGRNR
jgi:type III secretion protein J